MVKINALNQMCRAGKEGWKGRKGGALTGSEGRPPGWGTCRMYIKERKDISMIKAFNERIVLRDLGNIHNNSGSSLTPIFRLLMLAILVLLQLEPGLSPVLAAGEGAFDPRTVLDGLISTCGLIILVAGGALGVRLFFNGQMVQAVVAVLIAAFVFTILNTSALTEMGSGLKEFIWAGDSVSSGRH